MKQLSALLFVLLLLNHSILGQTDSVLVDFGPASGVTAMPWNNITSVTSGEIPNLADAFGFPTGKGIRITDRFNATNTFGTTNPDPALGYPVSATSDCFFASTVEFGGLTLPFARFELYNLDTSVTYTLEIFASRNHTINLQTRYIAEGLTSDTLYIDAASNTHNAATASIRPDAAGVIAVVMTAGPGNTSTNGFYYINALKLKYPHIPQAGPPHLELTSPAGGEFWQVGKTPYIVWNSALIQDIAIEYSTNMGSTWTLIDTVKHFQTPYPWTVPNTPSKQCLIRITSDTLVSVSPSPFEISTDTTLCTIVVLGSSTAAGAGAAPTDSSWVNRYRYALRQHNTRFEVVNLARGGYTTYHILPTGTTLPPNVSITIDTLRNITKALSHNPYGIIINMPSNDAAYGFPASEQMDNFRTLRNAALAAGAITWVCSPQPRNFTDPAKIQIQFDLYDSVMNHFGLYAIDFWTGIADVAGFIDPTYDSGDGIHLNNKGHRELFNRIMDVRTDTPGCAPYLFVHLLHQFVAERVSVYPNPFNEQITVKLPPSLSGHMILTMVDMHGRVLAETTLFADNSSGRSYIWHHGVQPPRQPVVTALIITILDNERNTIHRELVRMIRR